MKVILSKTDYVLFRECPKNVWYKIRKPDIYFQSELSGFEKSIIETGNEVELEARKLFPAGILIEGRGEESQKITKDFISKKQEILFQPIFIKDNYLAAVDILKFESVAQGYSIYEVKSTRSIDEKAHYHDLAFQVNLLRKCGLKINKAHLIHLNSEYIRSGELNIEGLFKIVDVSAEVESIAASVNTEAAEALKYISQDSEPKGSCPCIYKGRSNHCSTFQHANPEVPEYSVHDISRIGQSKKKLRELIDSGIFSVQDIPKEFKLSDKQRNQVDAAQSGKTFIDKQEIDNFLSVISNQVSFLDYETFPAAIPRFTGYGPFNQIPFQFSLHIFKQDEIEPTHSEFIFTENKNPDEAIIEALRKNLPSNGAVVVWYKPFEKGRNKELAERNPEYKIFLEDLNNRIIDIRDIFTEQHFIHPDFKGKTSIKNILPVLAPELSYKELEIQEGGNAAETWNKITNGSFDAVEKEKAINDLKIYCGLDTYAMYAIWKTLKNLI